jgi:hypothetical protein
VARDIRAGRDDHRVRGCAEVRLESILHCWPWWPMTPLTVHRPDQLMQTAANRRRYWPG